MGWDAFSSAKYDFSKERFDKKGHQKAFKDAMKFIQKKSGTADGGVQHGWLDCRICGEMLEKATGKSVWDDPWSIDEVIETNKCAQWDFKYNEGDSWAYWSARKFLETCAQLKLSIRFSW